jgi:hypothetical protein
MTVSELHLKLKELGFDVPIVMLTGVWTKKRVKRLHGYSRSNMKQIPEPKNPGQRVLADLVSHYGDQRRR